MQWDTITNIILISSIIILAVFAFLGLAQLIHRKSLKEVDKELRWMPLPLAFMTITYIIFDKFLIISTRPNGSGESSFPSTHVMIVSTIFFLVAIVLPRYIRSKAAYVVLDILMFTSIILTCFGRVLANMHWITDVIGAIAFSVVFATIYYLIIKKPKKEQNE